MKGLKTLTATLAAERRCWRVAPASASAAAYSHYVACGVSQNAKPAHVCQKARKKGAFFRSNNATVFYTVCVKFPTGKNLCAPRQEAIQGTLYVNKITSNIPGKHASSWFVEGKKVGSFVFTVPAALSLALVGFDTATQDTAVCAWRGGEVLYESLLGSGAGRQPGAHDAAAGGGGALPPRRPGAGVRSGGSRSGSARAPSPACGSASPAPAAWARPSACR